MALHSDHVQVGDYAPEADTIDVLASGIEDVRQLLLQASHARDAESRIAGAELLSEVVLPALEGAAGALVVYERASQDS